MSGPWEKYAAAAADKPWEKYGATTLGPKDVPDMPPAQGNSGQPDNGASFTDKVKGGLGAAATLASGATTGLLGRAGGTLGGIAGSIATGEFGTQQGAARAAQSAEEGAQQLTYMQSTPKSAEYLEDVGRVVDKTKLAGLGPTEAIGLAGATPGRAGLRAAVDVEANALKRLPGKTLDKVADVVTPKLDPDTASLAQKAQALGIQIAPDALADNRILKFIGQAFREVPLSGAMTKENSARFNSSIIKLIGGDEKQTKISPKVYDDAMNKSGSTIGNISARNPVPFYDGLSEKLEQHVTQARNFEPNPQIEKVIQNYVSQLEDAGIGKGQIDGTTMRKIRTQLTKQMRETSDGDLKHALSELDETLLDAVHETLSPKERTAFDKARTQYAIGKTIEPLIAKAAVKGVGDMSPAAFANQLIATKAGKAMIARGRGGEAGDLAAIGSRFLTEPGSSNTAERSLAYATLGGGGMAGGLPAAASIYSAANLYNRAAPALTKRAVNLRSVDPQATQPWNIGIP